MKAFEWKRLGDVQEGRANLGEEMPVIIYRLLQYTMQDILVDTMGKEKADEIFRAAGHRAGTSFAQNMLDTTLDFNGYIAQLQERMRELKIGILRIERADMENLRFTLTISEDLDCSGLPITDETVCVYDEGFIAGVLESYTGKPFAVEEIDCWATGDRTCRFAANAL